MFNYDENLCDLCKHGNKKQDEKPCNNCIHWGEDGYLEYYGFESESD